MSTSSGVATLLAAASFEDRSLVTTRSFLDSGQPPDNVRLANVIEYNIQHQANLERFNSLGIQDITRLDRHRSRDMWHWAWNTISTVPRGVLILDITCFPRELLGMILFATSLVRRRFRTIAVEYVSAPPNGYATQNTRLEESDRWLSRGVSAIRSIVGFPGEFSGEKRGHLLALVGHEYERLVHIIEYLEPKRLSFGSEQAGSSTVLHAGDYSSFVVDELRTRVEVPELNTISFRSDSIQDVYQRLTEAEVDFRTENVALTAMNTKLSFVGASLFGLMERRIRMVYAVPEEYNPVYCQGVGDPYHFDITDLINRATTEVIE